jgi:mRNA interferase RelE/StbE
MSAEPAYSVIIEERAKKELSKLGRDVQGQILNYLYKRIDGNTNPRRFGKALSHNKAGKWRYRVGDYRIICEISDKELVVLAIAVGHRREIYE